jgi:hypothetical protein
VPPPGYTRVRPVAGYGGHDQFTGGTKGKGSFFSGKRVGPFLARKIEHMDFLGYFWHFGAHKALEYPNISQNSLLGS